MRYAIMTLLWMLVGVASMSSVFAKCYYNDQCWSGKVCQNSECIDSPETETTPSTNVSQPSKVECDIKCQKEKCEWADKYTDATCSKSFSCETLEPDPVKANACNLARCEKQRGPGSAYCDCKYVQKGIPLNTSIPFIGNCLNKTDANDPNSSAAATAFPTIMSAATRILITVIMIVSFIMIIVWGIQWASGNAGEGKKMITKVAIWFALLGMMWVILRLINPNFFR